MGKGGECGGRVPGPQYKLATLTGYRGHCQSKYRNPAYSLSQRTRIPQQSWGPGPKYSLRKYLTRDGQNDPPAFTIPGRCPPPDASRLPGPGAYSPEKAPPMWHTRAPRYSLASRTGSKRPPKLPGPSDYGPPPEHHYPAYSIVGKPKKVRPAAGPGAAAYRSVPINTYLHRQPEVSLTGRNYLPEGKARFPGPDVYYPTFNTKKNPPKYSLGRKSNPCVGVYILPNDN